MRPDCTGALDGSSAEHSASGRAGPLLALLRPSHLSTTDDLPALVMVAGERLGARRTVLHVVDDDQVVLVPFEQQRSHGHEGSLPIEGTLAGRAFRTGRRR